MNRIKKLRSEAGLLQADLAKKLKIRQNTVSNWETGRHEPDQDALREMSKIFGVSIDYILGNTDIKSPLTSEDISGLTEKQIKILEMMDKLPEQDQDEIIQQAEYRIWLKQQKESGQ
ncbi:MAG TPA: helix-turn-helix domain-containing protein [Candidatus Agathobaculum intestinipullorum]|nr:helix-turn-helix domain-containing protein [Candidatus Agathobaculum intestinipullorum]